MPVDTLQLRAEIDNDPRGLGYAQWVALGADADVARLLNDKDGPGAGLIDLPSLPKDELQDRIDAVKAADEEITQALSSKTYEGLPYPQREPTPLRDMAYHLLWHVKELSLDREPLTNDQL